MKRFFLFMVIILTGAICLPLNLALAQYTISGTITDTNDAPVDQVDVFLYTEQGDPVGGVNPGVSDPSGFYSIGGGNIPSGIYGVGFEPPISTELVPVLITPVNVQSNTTLNVILEFGNHLSGFVRDSLGVGIPDIDLNAFNESSGQAITLSGDNTDNLGHYDILLPSAFLRIIYRPVQGENFVPIELRNVNIAADTTIDVVLRAGFLLSGTVTGPGGQPVVDADIDVEDNFTGEKVYTPNDNTDVNGHYQVRVPPGTFDVSVQALIANRLIPEIVYNVAIFSNSTVNFVLESGFLVSGTVRDPNLNFVANADLDVIRLSDGVKLFTPSDNTDVNGFYQLIIPASVYDMDFKPSIVEPYLAPVRSRSVNVTGDIVINITTPFGILLSGHVRDYHGSGVADANIDAKETPTGLDVPLVGDNTDLSGAYAMVLAPGVYDLEYEPLPGDRLAPERLTAMSFDVNTVVDVLLDTGLVVSGTVRDSLGALFSDVAVIAYENSSGQPAFTPGNRTDVNGYYQIFVSPDIYDFVYRPDTLSGVTDSVYLPDFDISSDTQIDIVFPRHSGDSIAPSVEVISPNGGETWQGFQQHDIFWQASDNVGISSVDIFFSSAGPGGPFFSVAIGEQNDGNYLWTVPAEPTSDGRIKIVVRDSSFNSANDISDSSFTIEFSESCCGGLKGDVNGSGQTNGVDVVYFVNYLKGGSEPPLSCDCGQHGIIFAPSDANGNCTVNGVDITYMVNYFKGFGPPLLCCPDCPQ